MKNYDVTRRGNTGFYDLFDSFLTPSKTSFKVDVKENDNEYIIEAELPGFKKEDVSASLHNHYLEIVATKNEETKQEGEYVHQERSTTTLKRKFYLENAVNEKIDAQLNDGILKMVVPKEKVNPDQHKIEIK